MPNAARSSHLPAYLVSNHLITEMLCNVEHRKVSLSCPNNVQYSLGSLARKVPIILLWERLFEFYISHAVTSLPNIQACVSSIPPAGAGQILSALGPSVGKPSSFILLYAGRRSVAAVHLSFCAHAMPRKHPHPPGSSRSQGIFLRT